MNNRIKCRDKLRAPGAREKKQLLRELEAEGEIAYSVVGDISKPPDTSTRRASMATWAARQTTRRRFPATRIAGSSA